MKKKMGRPPRYDTPDQLRAAAESYFDDCKRDNKPPTMSGLSFALGFTDRHAFTRQKNRGVAFLEVVQYCRLRVEEYNECRLYDPKGFRGAAYVLQCCFGWEKPKDTPVLPKVIFIYPDE